MRSCIAVDPVHTKVNKLDRYEILGLVGRGLLGVVHKARDRLTGSVVALKTIDRGLGGKPFTNFEWQFLEGALSAWRLKHANIVTIYDAGDAGSKAYIAMELLEGRGVQRILEKSPSLGIARSVKIAAGIARALAYAHEQGVVHRGVKPSNVIILGNDALKITDFGIARISEAAVRSGNWVGSPAYMSPEQIRGDPAVDARSDIFSLGAVFYEMLTGKQPFNSDSPAKIMQNVLQAEPPLPSEVNPQVAPELDGMILSMLAKHPDERVPSARIVLRDLRRLEEKLGGEAVAHPDEVPAATMGATLTVGARTSDDRDEPLVLADERATGRRSAQRPGAAVVVAVALAAAGLTALGLHFSDSRKMQAAAPDAERATAVAPKPSVASRPIVVADEPTPKEPVSIAPAREPSTPVATVPRATPETGASAATPAEPGVATISPRPKVTIATRTQPKTPSEPPRKTASLIVAVLPGDDIYIDGQLRGTTPPIVIYTEGKVRGTTPPIRTLELPPGIHRVEVRNSEQPPYLTYIAVAAGDVRRIRRAFE